MKTDRILKFVSFDVLEKRGEERRASRQNQKRHVDITEEDLANGKRHKEGREFANSPIYI